MDKVWENFPAIATLISGIVTVVFGTRWVAKNQGKTEIKKVELEGDKTSEGLYITNMGAILSEYKEQVAGYKKQLEDTNERISLLQKEFTEFRLQSQKEVKEYQEQIIFLEDKIETLETENEVLKEKIEKELIINDEQ